MIEWQAVFVNSLWILGLSVLLITFSYRSWAGSQPELSAQTPEQGGSARFYLVGLFLVASGLLGMSRSRWERLALGALMLWTLGDLLRQSRRPPTTATAPPTTTESASDQVDDS